MGPSADAMTLADSIGALTWARERVDSAERVKKRIVLESILVKSSNVETRVE